MVEGALSFGRKSAQNGKDMVHLDGKIILPGTHCALHCGFFVA